MRLYWGEIFPIGERDSFGGQDFRLDEFVEAFECALHLGLIVQSSFERTFIHFYSVHYIIIRSIFLYLNLLI